MIKITKPAAPDVLQGRGRTKRAEHCAAYDLAPADHDAGVKTFSFDGGLYSHSTVKQALIAAQHGRCCFCERKIGGEGDVEHFRPKASFCQGEGHPVERPGYYWLAYEWDNLLLACPICNQRFKRSLFPLLDLAKRARNHHGDVSQERLVFIQPAEEDPARFIGFRQEVAYAKLGSRRAKETIKALGLNREILSEARRGHLDVLATYRSILALEALFVADPEGKQLVAKAKVFLSDAILDNAEFASMVRAEANGFHSKFSAR